MSAKKNLTIRLDDNLRDKLEFIANRELRTLANQMLVFLNNGVNSYFANQQVSDEYLSRLAARVMADSVKNQKQEVSSEDSLSDIPF